jgi:hypothetical protein
MTIEQTLQTEIDESKKWLDRETEESTYKQDLAKRIELINWVLENMKNPNTQICNLIESKMNEIIDVINQTDSILEADKLDTEGPLDYLYTNFEDTNVITESVICRDMYYMIRLSLIKKEFEPRLQIPPSPKFLIHCAIYWLRV